MSISETTQNPDSQTPEEDGARAYMTGVQALVRVLYEQRSRDRMAGLNTGGFVSGYQGSPLGELDRELTRQKDRLAVENIRFQPALNEELAATAAMGSQQVEGQVDAKVDGVFTMWYGKGPGLDRAGDALKHANSFGSSAHGGGLVVVGDDHGAVSSSLAHQCEQVMASWSMPVLHPASVQEYLEFGLKGFALSRYSGCFVGFKAVSETVETSAAVSLDPERLAVNTPNGFDMPEDGPNIRYPDNQLAQEARLSQVKLPAVHAFARANKFDRLALDPSRARFGIAATGKAYLYLRQAMTDLGLDDAEAERLGLRVYKVGLAWPLEPEGAKSFAEGLEKVLVIEEKRAFVESQLKEILYRQPNQSRPDVLGKTDAEGEALVPSTGELDSAVLARVLVRFLGAELETPAAQRYLAFLQGRDAETAKANVAERVPFFCSGCPHNRSTVVPEGSKAMAGTGCHLLALGMNRRTATITHMGGEGVNWLGMEDFVETDHVFQNLGDGTYLHSGILGLRQVLATGANMTFKILFNDAVAMTGGQALEGGLSVPQLTRQVRAEGVEHIAVVSDDPVKYPSNSEFAPGVKIHHRDRLDDVQREFRGYKGVGVIVYDQTCAAELRRRRRRGETPDPDLRAYINKAVCEGCGDCSVQSNCMSVMTVDTPLGKKRVIDQSACNKDFSCLQGFCPAIVTLEGAMPRRRSGMATPPPGDLPLSRLPSLDKPYGMLVAGVGGTGVVTVGQIIGLAAHREGLGVSVLDFTGMAQKGGSVLTHVRLSADADADLPARLPLGGADLLLAGDLVVGASSGVLKSLQSDVSRAVVSMNVTPVAAAMANPDFTLDEAEMQRRLQAAAGAERVHFVAAKMLTETLVGDSIAANIFLLGYAFQKAAVPLQLNSLMAAFEALGRSVESNKASFTWGRLAAHDEDALAALAENRDDGRQPQSLDDFISARTQDLTSYQNRAYATRYLDLLGQVRRKEGALGSDLTELSAAVARGYFHLMAYKDEYEVARLFADPAFMNELKDRFEGDFKVNFHMAPPFLPGGRDAAGRAAKRRFGSWLMPVLGGIAALKGLRGGAFDPFGWSAERCAERDLINEYETWIEAVLPRLNHTNHAVAVEIAELGNAMRGFGPVKTANVKTARQRFAALTASFDEPGLNQEAAE